MAQLLQSPLMQPMLEQVASNPQLFMSQMEQMNPQAAAMLNANPQMRQMMMNPDFLRSMLNPQNMQAMMQMQAAMQQLQSSGLMPAYVRMDRQRSEYWS
jgi:ubiquilin